MAEKSMITMHEKNMQKVTATQKVTKVAVQFFLYAFLIVMALIVVFPFYWMIISSLKNTVEYRLPVPTLFPKEIMWGNYLEAFTAANLGRLFLNTVYVGIVSTILSLVITVLSAFAFARLEFKGKNVLFAALVIGLVTFALSFVATLFGHSIGEKLGNKAELVGGTVLILLSLKILLENLGVNLPF